LAHSNKFLTDSCIYTRAGTILEKEASQLAFKLAHDKCDDLGSREGPQGSARLEEYRHGPECYRMTREELLEIAAAKLAEAAKLLDRAGEETLADDALELAERASLRISLN